MVDLMNLGREFHLMNIPLELNLILVSVLFVDGLFAFGLLVELPPLVAGALKIAAYVGGVVTFSNTLTTRRSRVEGALLHFLVLLLELQLCFSALLLIHHALVHEVVAVGLRLSNGNVMSVDHLFDILLRHRAYLGFALG